MRNLDLDVDVVNQVLPYPIKDHTFLAGDGSDRSYFRLIPDDPKKASLALMQLDKKDSDLLRKNRYDWIHLANTLKKNEIRTPQIKAVLKSHGLIIMEDCGNQTVEEYIKILDKKNKKEDHIFYQNILDLIAKMLSIKPEKEEVWSQRSFDIEKLSFELEFFREKYFKNVLELSFSKSEQDLFEQDSSNLTGYIAKRPKFFVHRDFHSRNLMYYNNQIVLIDFQDARLGPACYDLISFCFDPYVHRTYGERRDLLQRGVCRVKQLSPNTAKEILGSWKAVILQRQLKILGSFGYLTKEKQKGDYLKYSRGVLDSLQECFDERWPFLSGKLITKMQHLVS